MLVAVTARHYTPRRSFEPSNTHFRSDVMFWPGIVIPMVNDD